MKLLWTNRVLLTALSVMTGAVKLASMPEEMELFRDVGFSDAAIWTFGLIQLIAGVLLIPKRTTHAAAWVMSGTFVVASAVVFLRGMIPFGLVSLLFILMAVSHAWKWPCAPDTSPAT